LSTADMGGQHLFLRGLPEAAGLMKPEYGNKGVYTPSELRRKGVRHLLRAGVCREVLKNGPRLRKARMVEQIATKGKGLGYASIIPQLDIIAFLK